MEHRFTWTQTDRLLRQPSTDIYGKDPTLCASSISGLSRWIPSLCVLYQPSAAFMFARHAQTSCFLGQLSE